MKTNTTTQTKGKRGRKALPITEKKRPFSAFIKMQDADFLIHKFGSATRAVEAFVRLMRNHDISNSPNSY